MDDFDDKVEEIENQGKGKTDREDADGKRFSEYTEYVVTIDLDTWKSRCTCVGFHMNQTICKHIKMVLSDERYKKELAK